MALAPLSMLPASATNMAVRCQSACIAAVGSDMDAWSRWSVNLDRWMAHPEFDMAEFNRLCSAYQVA